MTDKAQNIKTIAGSQFVAELPRIPQSELSSNSHAQECLLCHLEYDASTENALRLPLCGDGFHKACLLSWLSEGEHHQNTCPHCGEVLFNKLVTVFGSKYVAGLRTVVPAGIPNGFYDEACAVCQIDFEADTEDAVQMPSCLHIFDRTCLNEWLSEHGSGQNTCPICRHCLFRKADNNERPQLESLHSLPPGGPQGLVVHPRLQSQPMPQLVDPAYRRSSASARPRRQAVWGPSNQHIDINDRPHRIPISHRHRIAAQPQAHTFRSAADNPFIARRDWDKEFDERIIARWFELNFRHGVKTDVHLYDRCNRNLLLGRKNPQATLLTEEEELALFAAFRKHKSTFVLRFDAGIRTMWLVYCAGTEPYEMRNTSGNWTTDNNNWMLEGWHRKWGDFDAILGRWLRRGVESGIS